MLVARLQHGFFPSRCFLPLRPIRFKCLMNRGINRRRFKSVHQAQRFPGTRAAVYNLFNLVRHLISAEHYRSSRQRAFVSWKCLVAS